ncbi:hypothetical protein AB0N05_22745 [Nocardia sp. NPDC051030]
MLEPGLRPCALWRPTPEAADVTRIGAPTHELSVWEQLIAAALARKP